MIIRNIISVLSLVAVAIGSLFYMGSVGLSVTDNVNVRTASMTITNTNGLQVGSRVLLRGVAIGKITAVDPSIEGVKVTWNYKRDYKIPIDSQFRVDNLSALGETYLGIVPNDDAGPTMHDNAVLATKTVTVPPTIDEFSARFTRLIEQVNSEQVRSIIKETNTGLVADQTILNRLSKAGALLESTILTTRGSFYTLLKEFQPLLANGADISEPLAASGEPTKRFMAGVKVAALNGAATLAVYSHAPEVLLGPTADLLAHVQAFLDKSAPDLKILSGAALPAVSAATAQLKTVDLGQLMKTALATAGTGKGVVVHVGAGGN